MLPDLPAPRADVRRLPAPPPSVSDRAEVELQHVGNWLDDPDWFDRSGVTLDDLADPEARAIHAARIGLDPADAESQLDDLADRLEAVGDAAALRLGPTLSIRLRLAELRLERGEIGRERRLANRIRLRRLDDRIEAEHRRGGVESIDELVALKAEREALEFDGLGVAEIGLTGDRLEELAARPDPCSPLPGFLDPEPSLHVLHGVAKTGKTTLAWLLGLAWATGRSPWEGAPALPGTRVLILSGEQGARKCLRVLRRIARTADLGTFAEWRERVTIVGRRSEMTAIDRRLLRFDADGLAALRHVLDAAEREGDPFGLVIADSLSRLKPPAAATNNNDDMVGVLDPLAALAIEAGVYVLLIHHDGHSADRQGQAIDGVRGASAIRDVPQVLLAVSRVAGQPRQRMVRVAGNEVADRAQVFEVADDGEAEGHINRFRPAAGERALDLEKIFAEGPLSQAEFGRRALGWAPNWAPSGGAKEKAAAMLEKLEAQGLVRREGAGWDLARDG